MEGLKVVKDLVLLTVGALIGAGMQIAIEKGVDIRSRRGRLKRWLPQRYLLLHELWGKIMLAALNTTNNCWPCRSQGSRSSVNGSSCCTTSWAAVALTTSGCLNRQLVVQKA